MAALAANEYGCHAIIGGLVRIGDLLSAQDTHRLTVPVSGGDPKGRDARAAVTVHICAVLQQQANALPMTFGACNAEQRVPILVCLLETRTAGELDAQPGQIASEGCGLRHAPCSHLRSKQHRQQTNKELVRPGGGHCSRGGCGADAARRGGRSWFWLT